MEKKKEWILVDDIDVYDGDVFIKNIQVLFCPETNERKEI